MTVLQPAIHFYKQFGFAVERIARAVAQRDGESIDAYTMGRVHV